jgi:hypothetical protein
MKKRRVMMTVAVVLLTATGCDDARLKDFSDFAAAGSAYVTGFHSLTEAVADAEIAKSNAILLDARERMYNPPKGTEAEEKKSQAALGHAAEENTRLLKEYLQNLRKLDAHTHALGAYFKELASYTSEKNSKAITDSTDALAQSIEKLNPDIAKMKFGAFEVGAAKTAGNLAIAHIRVKTLDHILNRDKKTLDEALALQQQAVAALADDLADSVKAETMAVEADRIYQPYMNRGRLPATWEKDRERTIRQTVIVGSAEGAREAIEKLRASFVALVENKPAPVDLASILDAIEKMAGYAKAVGDVKDSK